MRRYDGVESELHLGAYLHCLGWMWICYQREAHG